MVPQLLIRHDRADAKIHVGGWIDASIATAFARALARDVTTLAAGEETISLDFEELDLHDGSAIAEAINALREIQLQARVIVRHAPHMLAHSLYKSGMLGDELELQSPRREEPHPE